MNEWQKVKLKDVINKIVDNRGKTPKNNTECGIPLLEVNTLCEIKKTPTYEVVRKYVDTETYNKCIEDRTYLSKILNEIRAKYWFYGHFHDHYSGSFGNLMYRGLGIKELFELRCLEDF